MAKGRAQSLLDQDRLILCLRVFYAFLLTLGAQNLGSVIWRGNLTSTTWLWPLWPLEQIPSHYWQFCLLMIWLIWATSFLALAYNPVPQWLRGIGLISFFLLLAAHYSFGKIDHSFHGALFCAFWFSLINFRKDNHFVFWAAQVSFLSTYFAAGVHKLIAYGGDLLTIGYSHMHPIAVNFQVNQMLKGRDWAHPLASLPQWAGHMLWVLLVTFEILTMTLAWKPQWQKIGGGILVIFHLLTALLLDVSFPGAMFTAFCLLILSPFSSSEETP